MTSNLSSVVLKLVQAASVCIPLVTRRLPSQEAAHPNIFNEVYEYKTYNKMHRS